MEQKRKNILFILSDDQGQWALGCYGNKELKTPNIDALAADGIIYDNYYCTSPVCSPARASIFTGTMPSFNGVRDWIKKGNAETADYPYMAEHGHFKQEDHPIDYISGIDTYVRVLHDAGYRTALCGKWHLGDSAHKRPEFDDWFTIFGGGLISYYNPDFFENGVFVNSHEHVTEAIGKRAVSFIDEFSKDETPFYLSVHFTAPHTPWSKENHPEEFWNLYNSCPFRSAPENPIHKNQIKTEMVGDTEEKRRSNLQGYYAAISTMDHQIGKIINKLKEKDLYKDTVIIFTSDNGMNLGHHGIWGKGNGTYPLNLYETSVKVPFIMKGPKAELKGQHEAAIASHYDLFQTFTDIAGVTYAESNLPGSSLFKTQEDRVAVVFNEYGSVRMIRKGNYKLIKNYDTGALQLFDLSVDPDEAAGIDDEDITRELEEQLEKWFLKYSNPEKDARRAAVTGSGQLGISSFGPKPELYR